METLNIPQNLDPMSALAALVAQSPSAQREDLPPTTQIIPDKDYSGPQRTDGATITDHDPLFTSPAPSPKTVVGPSVKNTLPGAATEAPLAPLAPLVLSASPPTMDISTFAAEPAPVTNTRFFFTGRTGVGKDWLAQQIKAKVLDASAPLVEAARAVFPLANKPEHFSTLFPTVFAWGEGTISKEVPLTPARWLFVQSVAKEWPDFGTPGFWIKLLVAFAGSVNFPRVAITNVTTTAGFNALKEAGFQHFHVMTSPQAYMQRTKKPGVDDRMAAALDQDAIRKVSAQRQGDRLPVIWNAPEASPSTRVWTVQEFLTSLDAAPVETFSAFE